MLKVTRSLAEYSEQASMAQVEEARNMDDFVAGVYLRLQEAVSGRGLRIDGEVISEAQLSLDNTTVTITLRAFVKKRK